MCYDVTFSLWMRLVTMRLYWMLSAKLQEFDFQAGVYHPLINYETGELETKQEFQRWRYCSLPSSFPKVLALPWSLFLPHTPSSLRRDVNHIHQLLMYARKIFYNIDVAHAVNEEAANL